MRLSSGGRIDRSTPVHFSFNGRTLTGYAGDTLASALLANDVRIVARSLKFHRPRGVMSAGLEEPNALVTVGEGANREVNVRATEVPLHAGLVARSQNCWPSVRFDLAAVSGWFSRLLPVGFHHKTFMWPGWSYYERAIRNAAGLGRIAGQCDGSYYSKRFHHCDVLVVGAGSAGLSAALRAAQTGADVTVLDADTEMGGSLLWDRSDIQGRRPSQWLEETLLNLRARPNVRLLARTTALGYYEDNFLTAVQHISEVHAPQVSKRSFPRQRLWKIRAAKVILATGAIERPLVFANNDLPGIMLASAVRAYANRYAVVPGTRVVVFTSNDSAHRVALDLHELGVPIAAVIDVRREGESVAVTRTRAAGIEVRTGWAVLQALGGDALRGVEVARLDEGAGGLIGGSPDRLSCDLLAVSGGWNPTTHLYSQAGGTLSWDPRLACFTPQECSSQVECVGAANGEWESSGKSWIQPWWRSPGGDSDRLWVDYLHDVTVADIELSLREGFTGVEHLKRYTTIGMAPDQGKTSNVNALAILARLTHREIEEVGTTTARPPYHPVAIGALAGGRAHELAQRYRRLPVSWHEKNGAVLEDHSGWLRPACYLRGTESEEDAIVREVRAARHRLALFDSSSLGKIEVLGPDAAEFLNRLYVNNIKTLETGRLRYGILLTENGVIKDDGVVGCLGERHYLVCTSSAGAHDVYFWMQEWLQCEWRELNVQCVEQTAQWATITLSGPEARVILSQLNLGIDLAPAAFPHMHVRSVEWHEAPLRIRRASYTGELSFELDIAADRGEWLWEHLLEIGKPLHITPLGMEALDVLRIEKGYLEVGVDTDGETTPLDVGWAEAIAKKSCDFLGRRSLARPAQQSRERLQLIGLLPERAGQLLPVGSHALDERGAVIGHVTSSCFSPHLDRSLALARLRAGRERIGQTVIVDVEGEHHRAQISERAFYDPSGARLNA